MGSLKDVEVQLQLSDNVKPKFLKPRTVPYILKQKVEAELDRLSTLGIILPVKVSKWVAPIVPVLKKNSDMRICGDFKTTVNQAMQVETYPLPRVKLAGGKYFQLAKEALQADSYMYILSH